MKKSKYMKKVYIKPDGEVVVFDSDNTLMSGSPAVQPGGGNGGSVTITPPEEDEDEELTGTRKYSSSKLWE